MQRGGNTRELNNTVEYPIFSHPRGKIPGETFETVHAKGGVGSREMSKTEYVLRSRDVAHMLDCSPDEVIELAQSKRLKATKQGRFWRYRATDVLAYKRRLETEDDG